MPRADEVGLPVDLAIANQARGDIIYFDGTNWKRLAKGADGHYLKIGANDPAWAAVSTTPADGSVTFAKLYFSNGADVIHSNLTERTISCNGVWVKGKESVVAVTGVYTVTFSAKGSAYGWEAQIRKNNSAVGTLRSSSSTSYVTYSEANISISAGDSIQIYTKSNDAGAVYVKDFTLGVGYAIATAGY